MRKTMTTLAALAALIPAAASAAWEDKNAVDGLDAVVGLRADVLGTVSRNGVEYPAVLNVNCIKNSTTVGLTYAGFAFYIGPTVRIRIDQQDIKSLPGAMRSDNHHWVGWYNGAGIPIIKSFYDAKTVKIEVTDRGDPEVFTFDVTGTKEAMAEIAKACKWN